MVMLHGMFASDFLAIRLRPDMTFQGAFTGNTVEISAVDSPVVLKASPLVKSQSSVYFGAFLYRA